jgi:aspartate ammonia-lyase
VVGITANRQRLAEQTSSFVGVITAFTPYIGYAAAAELARRALATGASVGELIVDAGLMAPDDVRILLAPARLAGEDTSEPILSREYPRDPRSSELRE